MKSLLLLAVALSMLIIGAIPTLPMVYGQAWREKALEAYLAIVEAEGKGADVSKLVKRLNEAIGLLESSSIDEAAKKKAIEELEKVIVQANSLAKSRPEPSLLGSLPIALTLAGLGFIASLGYLYLPRLILQLWVLSKRNWRVSLREE